ncbi:MAG: hypothetical protein JNM78_13130 [Cyclobacteriaceae bacterium]|nr:hypothetical protein [Cyclobacteriaceae bacterium]
MIQIPNMPVKSFEEMDEKAVDAKVAKAQVAFTDWKETYLEHFVVEGKLLTNQKGLNTYTPDQIEIKSYFRLRGNRNRKPEENALVYLLETFDGTKGILIYTFDAFTDCNVYSFLKEHVDNKKKAEVYYMANS